MFLITQEASAHVLFLEQFAASSQEAPDRAASMKDVTSKRFLS